MNVVSHSVSKNYKPKHKKHADVQKSVSDLSVELLNYIYTLSAVSESGQCATLQCMCTTRDCKRDQKVSCEAQSMCYVQYVPEIIEEVTDDPSSVQSTRGPSWRTGISSVVRGCIDDPTPLLCENRRPHTYTGTWPVLLCCKDGDWCNRGVMPTTPPWLHDWQKQLESGAQKPSNRFMNRNRGAQPAIFDSYDRSNEDDYNDDADDEYGDDDEYSEGKVEGGADNDDDLTRHLKRLKVYNYEREDPSPTHQESDAMAAQEHARKTVNPLFIGVPVAGACVLLAIVVFAIYILKSHNQYLAERNRRKAALLKQHSLIYAPPPGQIKPATCVKL
ncbi:hypothetical protein CAPTEDRAFT_204690 [Capitella teleta]|uniref:Activin types I and II receptor domain-containing protein n=1 Tax=Capitella teleta TaxID=283909 RepID=R7V0U2_CAPTE|nr:hypothetical protein CAPTEDRAFT_204690 [Capitella teleta]|eukprot:ELU12144.1 hypothetical protein CAPTEDRAFT_204690 [Capitella teleta]